MPYTHFHTHTITNTHTHTHTLSLSLSLGLHVTWCFSCLSMFWILQSRFFFANEEQSRQNQMKNGCNITWWAYNQKWQSDLTRNFAGEKRGKISLIFLEFFCRRDIKGDNFEVIYIPGLFSKAGKQKVFNFNTKFRFYLVDNWLNKYANILKKQFLRPTIDGISLGL